MSCVKPRGRKFIKCSPLRPHLFFYTPPRGKVKREKMKVSLKNAKEGKKRPRPGPGRAKIS